MQRGCFVSELLEQLSSFELTYWIEYFKEEPWGYAIENFRAGVVAATVANVAPRKSGSKSLKPSDFYPVKQKDPGGLTPRQRLELERRRALKAKNGSSRNR